MLAVVRGRGPRRFGTTSAKRLFTQTSGRRLKSQGQLRAMGLMRFYVHDRNRISEDDLALTYVAAADELPWYGRAFFSGDQLVIERVENESGTVWLPRRMDGFGELMLGTATLMERERPYLLEVELARGTVYRLRNQIFGWEGLGLVIPAELREQTRQATRALAHSATAQEDLTAAAQFAEEALRLATQSAFQLTDIFAEQALAMRLRQGTKLGTLLGVQLPHETPPVAIANRLPNTFNLVSLPFSWRGIEATEGHRRWGIADAQVNWAQTIGLKVAGGPLIEFDERRVPDWTYLWEGDFESLATLMVEHVRAVVKRYRGRVNLWQVASRMNRGHVLALSEEQRLQIVARAVRTVREIDSRTPVVVTFDQPWAEYMAHEPVELAPLHFADALVRADLGLSGLGLEINVGYWPHGSLARLPLAYSRLIDQWSLLELPLLITLSTASSDESDEKATSKAKARHKVEPDGQREWADRFLPLILAKNSVQVVIWDQLSDAQPHEFPNAGLFDARGESKPVLDAIHRARIEYLQ
jgi:hypothetical protein